jgi:hypothetical protein
MVATYASPGPGTLRIAPDRAAADLMGAVVIRSRKTGRAIRDTIPDRLRPTRAEWNRAPEPLGRYRGVMAVPEETIFGREALPRAFVPR